MNDEVCMIPIDQIRILNPRHRDKRRFELIVQSIRNRSQTLSFNYTGIFGR